MKLGTHVSGRKKLVSGRQQLETGQIYQVDMETTGLTCEEETINFLLTKLEQEYPELAVNWIMTDAKNQTIKFQFKTLTRRELGYQPQQLIVAGLIAWLPTILTLLGISLAAISMYNIISAIPWYAWALLGTGAFLLIFGPSLADLIAVSVYRPYPERR